MIQLGVLYRQMVKVWLACRENSHEDILSVQHIR